MKFDRSEVRFQYWSKFKAELADVFKDHGVHIWRGVCRNLYHSYIRTAVKEELKCRTSAGKFRSTIG